MKLQVRLSWGWICFASHMNSSERGVSVNVMQGMYTYCDVGILHRLRTMPIPRAILIFVYGMEDDILTFYRSRRNWGTYLTLTTTSLPYHKVHVDSDANAMRYHGPELKAKDSYKSSLVIRRLIMRTLGPLNLALRYLTELKQHPPVLCYVITGLNSPYALLLL